jgi:tripartite-type tricarboxylate transporter receptor subunit TctC
VPQDRVDALREAFNKTINDPEFLAEIKERNIMFNPMPGEKMAAYIDEVMKTTPEKIETSRKIYQEILDDIKK